MANTKLEKIANIEEEINQLKNRQKLLQQQYNAQERKARNHRLCKRGGLWESLAPETITLTDEQFKTFLKKTIATEYAKRILNGLIAQTPDRPVDMQNNAAEPDSGTATAKPTEAVQGERA